MILTTMLVLLGLIMAGLTVASAIMITGVVLSETYAFFPLTSALGNILWSASTQFTLVAIPLFIMMGELLLRSGLTEGMYNALNKWFVRVPGGLMHTNIAACAFFSATSGSSVATTATIGTISVPNIERYKYKPSIYLGSIAAGGTLGILIPPSINMILYGVMAQVSVTSLYLAGIIPGVLLALLFSFAIFLVALARPDWSGIKQAPVPLKEKLKALVFLIEPFILFVVVIGSIYAGIATPTEAAAFGVVGALFIITIRKRLSLKLLSKVFRSTMRTTCMVMLVVLTAYFLNFVLSNIGMIDLLVDTVNALDVAPLTVLLAIIVIYLIMGCFMETISLMIATTPIVVPIITALGYDPIWFGVLFMILIEAALITPPIGVNLFVVQSVRGKGPFKDVIYGALPFLLIMILMIFVLIAFPQLALFLPEVAR